MKIVCIKRNSAILYCISFCIILAVLIFAGGGIKSVFNETAQKLLPIYCVDKGDEKICAMSFDAAWDDSDTDRLIDIFNKYNVKTTFFIVGSWVEKYPESVKKFSDNGHEIVNHSDTHPHINKLSTEKIKEEITNCDDKIELLTGKRPKLFRGPYGEYNNAVIEAAESLGHKVIQWDVDSLDWKNLSSDEIYTRVINRIKPGSIMLFHNGAKNTPEALPKIIEKLQTDGYKIVPVSELILYDNYSIDHTGMQIESRPQNTASN